MTKYKPLVSVIIPTYNRECFVRGAIESVLDQTYPQVEVIVVDDGSTDNTESAIKTYDRVTYIKQDHAGVSAARNRGIEKSAGEYIAFLDSDDVWKKEKLAKQIDFFQSNPDISLCQTDEIWIRNGKWANPMKKHKKRSGHIFEHSLALCIISPSSVMIRRDLFEQVGLFDETMPACEDYDLWLRITPYYPVALIDEKLVVKRGGHDDQLSKMWGLDRFRIRALEKLLTRNNLTQEQRAQAKNELIKKIGIYSAGCRKRQRMEECRRYQEKLDSYLRHVF